MSLESSEPVAIIGDPADPHVQAVTKHIPSNHPLVILDSESLQHQSFTVSPDAIMAESSNGYGQVSLDAAHRGWIRRLSPEAWEEGVTIGGKEAAIKAAWLALLVSFIRNPACEWLTKVDSLLAAENKLVQYGAARRLKVATPRSIVTNNPEHAALLSSDLIVKPLGPQQFHVSSRETRKIFTQTIRIKDPAISGLLSAAPFIIQERLAAISHLRIVTVCGRAWSFAISAVGLPLDWREDPAAHSSWKRMTLPEIEKQAVALAGDLSVRYSSQDWIETKDGSFFIDLNPGGQWLFLPDPAATEVSAAIARWIRCVGT